MSKSDVKLGRNPLSRIKSGRKLKQVDDPVAGPEKTPYVARAKTSAEPSLDPLSTWERLHEMQIQVDWQEFFNSAIASKIKRLTRLFS